MGDLPVQDPRGLASDSSEPGRRRSKLIEELQNAEYLIYYRGGHITSKLVEGAKHLKLIQTCGQDTGNLPVAYALSKGIYAANAGGANAISVAE